MTNEFDNYRFGKLNYKDQSKNYYSMDRVSSDEETIVVNVGNAHLFKTAYGYGLILDAKHLVWLKRWQVNQNFYGNQVLLNKKYFKVVESTKKFDSFFDNEENCTWDAMLKSAKMQRGADTDDITIKKAFWRK